MVDNYKTDIENKAKKAEYARNYYRKKNSAISVKGVMINCATCNKETEKNHWTNKWCNDCAKSGRLERRTELRTLCGLQRIGMELECKECKATFIKTQKRQFYCPVCSKLSEKSALPKNIVVKNANQNRYNKELRIKDYSYAIHTRMGAQIRLAMREKKAGRGWESIVVYRLLDLTTHLEKQFLKGMSWDKRSEWHIDHIIPVSIYDFTLGDEVVKQAWALSNIRPMWARDNVRKSNKLIYIV